MIRTLELKNVGPAKAMNLSFNTRFNLITGDNGLGKSFILDLIWWTLTRQWPQDINPTISGSRMALPQSGKKAEIMFSLASVRGRDIHYSAKYDSLSEMWKISNALNGEGRGRPVKPGIVVYGMVDGSFALWDPARNYWRDENQSTRSAYVFSPYELWNGQKIEGEDTCNGIIRDWAYWYKENGASYDSLCSVLKTLTDDGDSVVQPMGLTRVSARNVRDVPTISMPYTQGSEEGVAIVHASSAVKRIIAMAYMMIWAWREHCQAIDTRNRLRGGRKKEEYTSSITFILDEVEAHLHPRWQRIVLEALHKAIQNLTHCVNVQLVISTHSPLVMASCEDFYDAEQDRWFDIDRCGSTVELVARNFEPMGTVNSWLLSHAFDLPSLRSKANESLVKRASELLEREDATELEIKEYMKQIQKHFSSTDRFASFWMYMAEKRLKN